MIRKNDIIEKAYECGFGDIGFTTADPFDSQRELLEKRQKEYEWASKTGLDLIAGTDPIKIFPNAKTIIVLMEVYFKEAFPSSMENYFGRCYLDDDRRMMDRLTKLAPTNCGVVILPNCTGRPSGSTTIFMLFSMFSAATPSAG